MSFISIILQGLFLYLLGVVLYCYGDTNYVANAEHPLLEKVCLSILTGIYIFMCPDLILK